MDVFPILKHLPKWLPGIQFHKVAERGRPLALALVMGPYEEVQSQVVICFALIITYRLMMSQRKGIAVPSVASKFLYEVQDGSVTSPSDIEMMRNVLGNAYLGELRLWSS